MSAPFFSCQHTHSCPLNFAHASNTFYPYILFDSLSHDGTLTGQMFFLLVKQEASCQGSMEGTPTVVRVVTSRRGITV